VQPHGGVNMGALAEASASDEAAYYAGRAVLPEKETILSKLVSCVLYSVGVCFCRCRDRGDSTAY